MDENEYELHALAPTAEEPRAPEPPAKPKRKYNKSGKYKKRAKKVSGVNAQTQAAPVMASVTAPDLRPAGVERPAGRQPDLDHQARFIAKVFSAPVRAILSERDGILTLTPRPIVKPWMVVGAGAVSLVSLAWYLAWYQW